MDTPNCVLRPATRAGEPKSSSALTLDLANLPQVDTQLSALLPQLARLDDDQLVRLAAGARRLETYAFRLRGACVAELRRRIKIRLSSGRGKRDTSGVGIKAHLAHLASDIGVSITTLNIDARIHEVFFTDAKSDTKNDAETGFAREPSLLAREFYAIALSAPDPHAAIRDAEKKCAATTDYHREDFRRDVLGLKQRTQPMLAASSVEAASKPAPNLRVVIVPEAQAALTELINRSGQSPETVVAEALLAYHRTQIAPAMTDKPATIIVPSAKKERRANSASEPQMQPSLLSPSLFGSH